MKKIITKVVIVLLAVVCLGLSFTVFQQRKEANENMEALKSEIVQYKDRLGRSVAEMKSLKIEKKSLKFLNDSLQVAIKNIKPQVIVEYRDSVVFRDTALIPYEPIPLDFKRSFEYKNKWVSFSGIVSNWGVSMREIAFYNKTDVIIGQKKDHWYSNSYSVVRITNSNPYSQTISVNNYVVKQKIKWYKNPWLHLGVGILGGILISK